MKDSHHVDTVFLSPVDYQVRARMQHAVTGPDVVDHTPAGRM